MLEWTIRNLGEEINQPSNPYANLSQYEIRRVQVNALKVLIPNLTPDRKDMNTLPYGARDLGDGFVLLHAYKEFPGPLYNCVADMLRDFLLGSQIEDEIYV